MKLTDKIRERAALNIGDTAKTGYHGQICEDDEARLLCNALEAAVPLRNYVETAWSCLNDKCSHAICKRIRAFDSAMEKL